jgi:CheY-like chemotaxis protein
VRVTEFTILMVTDDPDQRELFTLVLTSRRLHVDAVGDAESALQQLSVHAYDILLTDYELPMITGSELIHRVRHCWPSIRIVLMSNHTHIRELAAQLDVDAYFSKMNAVELPNILQAVMVRNIS